MQTSRLGPIAVWCLLVLVGTIFLTLFGRPQGPVASRILPMNTYIIPGDLTYPGYDGRYIVAPKGLTQGATLQTGDTADQPNLLDGSQGKLLLLVNVDRSVILGGLNAGGTTLLCGNAPAAYGAVTVQAVRCEADKSNNRCIAMVDLPKASAGDVVAKGLKDQTATTDLRLATKCD
jgi:hypothetical protein